MTSTPNDGVIANMIIGHTHISGWWFLKKSDQCKDSNKPDFLTLIYYKHHLVWFSVEELDSPVKESGDIIIDMVKVFNFTNTADRA